MVNLLGQHIEMLPELLNRYPLAMFHLYNKGEAKRQRKMGHFTLLGTQEEKMRWLESLNEFKAEF